MRGVQFALLFAILTQRVLLLDWPPDPFEIETVLQPAAIDWTVPSKRMSSDLILDWYSCHEGNVCENGTNIRFAHVEHLPVMKVTPAQKRKERLRDMNLLQDDAQERLDSFERVSIIQRFRWDTTRLFLQAYNSRRNANVLAGLSDLQLQRALANALFQPSATVRERMSKVDLIGRRYVALHIRTDGEGSAAECSQRVFNGDLRCFRLARLEAEAEEGGDGAGNQGAERRAAGASYRQDRVEAGESGIAAAAAGHVCGRVCGPVHVVERLRAVEQRVGLQQRGMAAGQRRAVRAVEAAVKLR
ncbi:hypothetical protein FGB62_11g10 [Gracilaria domingensis]|nr:hypothetical protein FGB62_11g10 [Gracilaria domingensis]